MIYASVVPFDFIRSRAELSQALAQINLTPFFLAHDISAPDVVSNLALFFPFGLLISSIMLARLPLYVILCISLCAGVLFSCFLELLQLLTPGRVTSVSDVINNGIGSVAGAMAAYLYHRYIIRYVEPAVYHTLKRPILEVYTVFVFAGILFFALAPFDISIDIGDLKNSVKHFLRYPQFIVPWKYMQSSINNFIFFLIAGAFSHAAFFSNRHRIRGALRVLLLCTLFAVAVEILQLVIVSRSSSISNIFFAISGTCGGIAISFIYIKNKHAVLRSNRFFMVMYVAYIFFNTLFPFQLEPSVSSKLSMYTFIPFSMYFVSINIFSVADLSTQIITFIPLGICGIFNKTQKNSKAFVIGFISGMILEVLQVFIATRYCDSTDAILAGAGALAGVILSRRFTGFRESLG